MTKSNVAVFHSACNQRLLDVFMPGAKHVCKLGISILPDSIIEVRAVMYIEEHQIDALCDELEANPPTLKEKNES